MEEAGEEHAAQVVAERREEEEREEEGREEMESFDGKERRYFSRLLGVLRLTGFDPDGLGMYRFDERRLKVCGSEEEPSRRGGEERRKSRVNAGGEQRSVRQST